MHIDLNFKMSRLIRINVKRLVHNLFYQPFNVNKCTLFVLFISFCKIRHETSLTEVEI